MKTTSGLGKFVAIAGITLFSVSYLLTNSTFGNEYPEAPTQNPALGELKIVGKYIERLVLYGDDKRFKQFNQPPESVRFPIGKYRLCEIFLERGFIHQPSQPKQALTLTVTENKQVVLKAGAPLEQKVKVNQMGGLMALDYELCGIGGEGYIKVLRGKPPTFIIYKGEEEIFSSEFEYDSRGDCSYLWRVPLTAFGQLEIVPHSDIGQLGPNEGIAVVYDWRWYYNLPGLSLWLVLILALALVKDNRNPRAWLILTPLLIVNLLWLVVKDTSDFRIADTEMFNITFQSLVIGITALWLLAHKLDNRNRFFTFLSALAVLAAIGLLGTISLSGFSQKTIASITILAVLVLAMLLGFTLAGWLCRKHYSDLRFIALLALCNVIVCIMVMLAYAGVSIAVTLIQGYMPGYSSLLLLQALSRGILFGVSAFMINLPYMTLVLRGSFFRRRFFDCLHLKSMPEIEALQTTLNQTGEQNPGATTSENSNPA
ncbi:MAG: hypothetical protein ACYS0I_08455 [Planctomycetota bacterium]|jgi:hypothetical protein